jgi:hypothetical protein
MQTPITNTTVTFTYNIADEQYSSSNSENKTVTAIYTGPDRSWIFVNAATGDVEMQHPILTTRDDGADVPSPVGTRKVEVVAATDPIVMALIYPGKVEVQDQEMVTEILPDGSELTIEAKTRIDQTYELDELVHNGSEWILPAFKRSNITWTDVINARNGQLLASDGKISPDQPDSVKQPWIDFRNTLRNLPATFGRGTANETAAWKISMPKAPE